MSDNHNDKSDAKSEAAANPFVSMAEGQLAQLDAFYGEVTRLQTASLEQTRTAMEESTRLTRETLDRLASMGAESRRLTLDAFKRSMGLFAALQ